MVVSQKNLEKGGLYLLIIVLGLSGIYTRQWLSWILPLCTLLLLWERKGVRGFSLKVSPPFVFLFLFLIWGGVSVLWAPYPWAGLKIFLKVFVTCSFGFIFVNLLRDASAEVCQKVYKVAIVTGTVLSILIISQSLRETFAPNSFYIMKHSGSILGVSAFVGCGLLWIHKQRLMTPLALIGIVFVIYLTGCQTALYALLCGMGIFIASYFFPRLVTWCAVVGSYTLLILTPFFYCYSGFALEVPWVKEHKSFFHRVLGWDFLTQKVFESPFLGWGMGATPHLAETPDIVPGYSHLLHPHNHGLQSFLELGLLGGILFALFVASLFWMVQKHVTDRFSVGVCNATLAAFLIEGQISQNLWYNYWLSWELMVAGVLIVFLKLRAGQQPA